MNYRFEKYNYFDERDQLHKSTSIIILENQEDYGAYFITEIKNLSFDYLEEIVAYLEKILSGDLQEYDFGYEVYSIECKKSTSVVLDLFEEEKLIVEIPTQELYELLLDWKNHLIENPSTIIETSNSKSDDNLENIPPNYIFFDGLKTYKVNDQYYDWLSSDDYAVWSNSYVEIQNKRIYIIKENVKILSTFRYFRKEELELLAIQYNLKIKEKDSIYYAYSEPHSDGQYQICENDQLTVIYSTNGSYGPESIFIYGVFEK